MHLNRDYRYDGKQHDLATLFTIQDLTRQIKKLDADLAGLLKAQRKALAQADPTRHLTGTSMHRSVPVRVLQPLQSGTAGTPHLVSPEAEWQETGCTY